MSQGVSLERLRRSVLTLVDEGLAGPSSPCWYLDAERASGLLPLLEGVSPELASRPPRLGRANVAAHTDHVRYALELANRALRGDREAFATADWRRSWAITSVDAEQWSRIRRGLRQEYELFREFLSGQQSWAADDMALTGVLAQLAHLAYHLGAIRQVLRDVSA